MLLDFSEEDEEQYLVTVKESTPRLTLLKEFEQVNATISHVLVEDDQGRPEVIAMNQEYVPDLKEGIQLQFMYHFIKF